MPRKPDFFIIGAMKCGTSTLYAQIEAQDGVFMCEPKEPNFFSDNDEYAKGLDWYFSLFADAAPSDILGEASTHYTKLPTYPKTLSRMAREIENPKLIYMLRDPIERARSHYIHTWSQNEVSVSLDNALQELPELIEYGCYGRQITPFVEQYGIDAIHVTSLEAMKADRLGVLTEACRFIGYDGVPGWQEEISNQNVSAERIRDFPLRGLLVDNPVAAALRRALVPKSFRNAVKSKLQMQDRPEFSAASIEILQQTFLEDREVLRKHFPDTPALKDAYPFAT